MRFQCKKGHEWEAIPDSIRTRRWCAQCGHKVKYGVDIEAMKKLAWMYRGWCLSKKYINAKTKLKWKCAKGHIWMAVPDSIKHETWCPYCAGNRKIH